MKHNDEKLRKLNNLATIYYYAIGNRDYVHSTSITALCYRALQCNEITSSLRKVITSGFYFSDIPSEEDAGFVVLDNSVFYIRLNDSKLAKVDEKELEFIEHTSFTFTSLVATSLDAHLGKKCKYLSKKLTAYCPVIFSQNIDGINVRIKKEDKFTLVDITVNDILAYRQYVHISPSL